MSDLLDRDVPDDYRDEWAARIAVPLERARRGTESVLVFRVGGESFALPSTLFEDVRAAVAIHSVPHRSGGAFLGLANVRGELVPVLSLPRLLGVAEDARTEQGGRGGGGERRSVERTLVLRLGGGRVAVPVEGVLGVHRHQPNDLTPVPATLARSAGRFTRGLLALEGMSVAYLDPERVSSAVSRSLE